MRNFLYSLATDKYNGFGPGILKLFLFLFSLIYGVAVRIAAFFNRCFAYRPDCKVISVGNITLGGTGKTSLVEYIAQFLKQQGHKVAVISRGYKRKVAKSQSHSSTLLGAGKVTSEEMGDEPYMLSRKLTDIPIIVDKNRIRAIERALKDYAVDTIILDDAFQQWKIKKGLEIVAINAADPFGNRRLLPRGILREPLSSLKRSDIFVLAKTNLNPDIASLRNCLNQVNPRALIVETVHQPIGFYSINNPEELLGSEALKGITVCLFSGIGDPRSFEELIVGMDIKIGLSFRFFDHHHYSPDDIEKIIHGCRDKKIDTLITTEKDAARLATGYRFPVTGLRFLVLRIALEIKDKQLFNDRLLNIYPV